MRTLLLEVPCPVARVPSDQSPPDPSTLPHRFLWDLLCLGTQSRRRHSQTGPACIDGGRTHTAPKMAINVHNYAGLLRSRPCLVTWKNPRYRRTDDERLCRVEETQRNVQELILSSNAKRALLEGIDPTPPKAAADIAKKLRRGSSPAELLRSMARADGHKLSLREQSSKFINTP